LPDASERLNYADTVKVQWTAALSRGRVLFSDMGRVMFSMVEDSCGAHDSIAGGSTPDSVLRAGGNAPARNTRDNFLLAAGKHGLSRRDVPPCISFFAPVATDSEGRLVWNGAKRQTGDYVDLRAEMDLLVALSNCPHPLDPEPLATPPTVAVDRFQPLPPGVDDLCRTATAEAARGFENTEALYLSRESSR
jgi:urea carboxylase-associated protein 2